MAWYSSLGKVKLSRTSLGFLAFCSTAVLVCAGLAVSAALMDGLTIGLTKALLAGLLTGLVAGLVASLVAALVVFLGAVLVADFVTCFAAGLAALLEADLEEGLRGAEAALGATGLTSAAGFAARELGLLTTASGEGVVEEFIMHQRNQS